MEKVPWNRVILDEFIFLAMLTEEEEKIVRARAARWSRVKMCHTFNMSLATLDRTIRALKDKYESVVAYSDKLPTSIKF